MTWNSSYSIASDDDSSRHSFLSDCDSEFDLKPPPRYPAEKHRPYSTLNKQLSNRIEPPLTRSRAKAIGKNLNITEPLPKQRRHSALRRSIDAFTGMATTLTSSLNNNSILFPKQESSTPTNDRVSNAPLDGVNFLADRFESCSLDEGKLNRNCVWPSRETNSHYTRPVTTSSPRTNTFGTSSFSTTTNKSPLFAQSSTPTLFGQQQAQLWTRFRFAASTLRNNFWFEQTDNTNLQQVPSNIFTSIYHNHNPFDPIDQSPSFIPPQTVPTRLVSIQNKSSPLSVEETSSSPLIRQRKISPTNEPIPSIYTKEDINNRQSTLSKIFFTLTIFIIGLVIGCLLTNTLPSGYIWKICLKYFQIIYMYISKIL